MGKKQIHPNSSLSQNISLSQEKYRHRGLTEKVRNKIQSKSINSKYDELKRSYKKNLILSSSRLSKNKPMLISLNHLNSEARHILELEENAKLLQNQVTELKCEGEKKVDSRAMIYSSTQISTPHKRLSWNKEAGKENKKPTNIEIEKRYESIPLTPVTSNRRQTNNNNFSYIKKTKIKTVNNSCNANVLRSISSSCSQERTSKQIHTKEKKRIKAKSNFVKNMKNLFTNNPFKNLKNLQIEAHNLNNFKTTHFEKQHSSEAYTKESYDFPLVAQPSLPLEKHTSNPKHHTKAHTQKPTNLSCSETKTPLLKLLDYLQSVQKTDTEFHAHLPQHQNPYNHSHSLISQHCSQDKDYKENSKSSDKDKKDRNKDIDKENNNKNKNKNKENYGFKNFGCYKIPLHSLMKRNASRNHPIFLPKLPITHSSSNQYHGQNRFYSNANSGKYNSANLKKYMRPYLCFNSNYASNGNALCGNKPFLNLKKCEDKSSAQEGRESFVTFQNTPKHEDSLDTLVEIGKKINWNYHSQKSPSAVNKQDFSWKRFYKSVKLPPNMQDTESPQRQADSPLKAWSIHESPKH